MFNKIAFVCLGNICRSPTAEAIAKSRVADRGLPIEVESFGTGSWHIGGDADVQALQALNRAGFSHKGHGARQISNRLVEFGVLYVALDHSNYRDLSHFAALVASPEQLTMLRFFDPELNHLTKVASSDFDVADPYHRSNSVYDETLRTIERCIDPLLDFVVR